MDILPDEILSLVFKYLDFRTRLISSLVCKKWQKILTNQGSAKMDDIAVLNIFQKSVWDENIALTAKSRLKSIQVDDVSKLKSVAAHVGVCNSLKLWFRTTDFVDYVLKTLADRNLRMRCLDLYPYGYTLPMHIVKERYPDVEALILRPHGADYFWNGMPFDEFPEFGALDSLILDSVTLNAEIQLPPTLSQLEWSHRDDGAFANFLDKLPSCVNLKYLLISHVQLDEIVLRRLLDCFSSLRQLMVIVFKFVRFASIEFLQSAEVLTPPPLKSLKFDLCYGDIRHTVLQFLQYASSEMQFVQINSIYEENQLNSFYKLVPALNKRNIWLQFGVLQRQPSSTIRVLPVVVNEENDLRAENNDNNDFQCHTVVPYPPLEFRDVLCKLDLSFVEDAAFLVGLLSCGVYSRLLEARFIQCSALTDVGLELLSKNSVRLRKLYINGCDEITSGGLEEFCKSWNVRKSKELNIVWRSEMKFKDFAEEFGKTYPHLNVSYHDKKLPNDTKGQKIVVWDCRKMLTIQDYAPNDLHSIMGFVVP